MQGLRGVAARLTTPTRYWSKGGLSPSPLSPSLVHLYPALNALAVGYTIADCRGVRISGDNLCMDITMIDLVIGQK